MKLRITKYDLRIGFGFALTLILIFQNIIPAFACGPGYVSPVFDYKNAPENPYANFAAGKLGIIKPTYHRIVLFAAYRYLNGGGFSAEEQKGLVEVWNAEFDNKSYDSGDDTSAIIKKWVEARKQVFKEEENQPKIYTERQYGGYDFFPNCTASAFETATETLNERVASHGAEDRYVQDWVRAQDKVFLNCANGQSLPEAASPEAPEWLRKDREYQIAAANFYSLNYETARSIWSNIAVDSDSVWAETADYLIARTLVREASLKKDETEAKEIYLKAEEHLQKLTARGGKFNEASVKLMNLVKYRIHPEERTRELAQTLSVAGGSSNFRQDFIDYSWLLDKFQKQVLEAEEKRKEELKKQEEARKPETVVENSDSNSNSLNSTVIETPANLSDSNVSNPYTYSYEKIQSGESLNFYIVAGGESSGREFTFPVSLTNEEIYTEVENKIGRPLTDKEKTLVQEAREQSYRNKTNYKAYEDYQGGYYGSEKTTLRLLPEFLRGDELTDWLFTYQIKDEDAYEYALKRWRQNKSNLWLMTAISKAEITSPEVNRLLSEAEKTDRTALAYPTIAYHTARLYAAQGKTFEARKLLDEILNSTLDLPISSRNLFLEQRMSLAETLEDFLKFALRKPFAFDFDGSTGSIDEFIAEQKSWYDPENSDGQTREEHDRQIEESFKNEKLWQDRWMFDEDSVAIMSRHFPLTVLLEAEKSPALPEYLRQRLATIIWTRAILFDNDEIARKISPEVLRLAPEFSTYFQVYQAATTPLERKRAAFYLILKNPILTPEISSGIGKTDNENGEFDYDDWWCAPYDDEDVTTDEIVEGVSIKEPSKRPAFLSKDQSNAAQAEHTKLKQIGDAPKYLSNVIMQWQKAAPGDKRVPEMLYIMYRANGWTKYGCGNDEELQKQIGNILKTRYPKSRWTAKLDEPEN